jgi:hypothetical protein
MAFINQDTTQQDQDNSQDNFPANPPATSPNPAPMGMSAPTAAPQPKGSGRFTNIQKYISANQGAGDRLAGGVGTKINSQLNPALQKTDENLQSVRQGIEAGKNTLNQGNQLNTQVQDTNFDATGFASNQGNVDQFTQFRTGNAFDENALKTQAQMAQQQALEAQAKAQQLGQQFGSEQGRQALLKQTFSPSRNYTVGQQRLDGLFLQQATPQIQAIQGNISDAQKKLASNNSLLNTDAGTVNDLATQEQELAQNLTKGISNREQDLMNAVSDPNRMKATNDLRMLQQKQARDQFGNLVTGKTIDQGFANLVGLNNQDRLYNVLKNNANIDDYLKFNDVLLTSPDQLANQQERTKYDAIARLAGLDPNQRQIKLDTQIKNAVDSTGRLRTDVDSSKANFDSLKSLEMPVTGTVGLNSAQLNGLSLEQLMPLAMQLSDADRALGAQNYFAQRGANQLSAPLQTLVNQVQGNPIYTPNTNYSVGLTDRGVENLQNTTKYQALLDAYNRLAKEGYLQDVKIGDPTMESGNGFNVR